MESENERREMAATCPISAPADGQFTVASLTFESQPQLCAAKVAVRSFERYTRTRPEAGMPVAIRLGQHLPVGVAKDELAVIAPGEVQRTIGGATHEHNSATFFFASIARTSRTSQRLLSARNSVANSVASAGIGF
jgi:hypothetical protein